MWHIANQTPFAADYGWVMDKIGNRIWLVVAKATFSISSDGRCILAAENDPVRQVAQPYGEFGLSSLKYESDLAGVKTTTDLLVRGDAVAPKGYIATSLDVSLRVGPVAKRLRVTGDRVWKSGVLGPRITDPIPFERLPITYERAFGGWDRFASNPDEYRLDERNPVGTGFVIRAEHCEGLRLPNVEYPDHLISNWRDRPPPAGLNAIDCAWLPRRQLAGTYDDAWRRNRFPLWAEDFNQRYHNCSPADQQPDKFFTGGEHVEVTSMSEHGTLTFDLPKIGIMFRTRFGSERVDQEGQLCTVVIEPNIPRVTLTWQASLVCNRRADDLDETLVIEK